MKKILSIFTAIAIILSVSSVSAKSVFKDVPEDHWAQEQIAAWSNYGVISGYNGEFSPGRSITRGEFAVVLNRLMNYQKTQDNAFSDLDENFYTDSVLKLNKAGVMQGYENSISPNANLTRQEAASLICRALGIEGQKKADKTFADSDDVSSWAKESMNAMINLGLINGADGRLNPQKTITRAEVVTILDNAVLPVLTSGEVTNIDTDKILVISSNDVTIKDTKINGKVIITQGVTEGKVEFVNTKIEKEIEIDNDRNDFVVLKNTTVDGETIEEGVYQPKEKEPSKEEEKPSEDDISQGGSGTGGGNKGDSSGDSSGNDNTGGGNTGGDNTGGSDSDKDDPENPVNPENPQEPENPENPENPDTPQEPENPENPENPETPDTPDTPDTPQEPETPETPDEPVVPDEPDVPEVPEVPEEPEMGADDYISLNAEMVSKISSASKDIEPFLTFQNQTFNSQEKYFLKIIKQCMDATITMQDKKIINKSFLKEEFPDEIAEVKKIYEEMENAGTSASFTEKMIVNLNSATIEWLADEFELFD